MGGQFNYIEEVKIDQHQLDLEWRKQPLLVVKYNDARADAQQELDEAKDALDILIAQKDLEIRDTTNKKPTETAITNMILLDPEVQEEKSRVNAARHRVELLKSACAAFDVRKSALENLVKLYLSGYYAEPNADIVARGRMEEQGQKEIKEKVRNALNKKMGDGVASDMRRTK